MGKSTRSRNLPDHAAQAMSRRIRVSPQKLNLVAAMIRGCPVDVALARLTFCRKRVAESVKKVLESSISNAENNHGLDIDALVVREAYVGKSLRMRRFRPRAKGVSARIIKPFSRLTVVVEQRGTS